MLPWHQYLLGVILILAGANHFRSPKMYLRIMPAYIPAHSTIIILSGVAEMILGFMLLNPETQAIAAWGAMLLLLVFLPIHFYMLQNRKAFPKIPYWALILRIGLQFVLIYWAYLYI